MCKQNVDSLNKRIPILLVFNASQFISLKDYLRDEEVCITTSKQWLERLIQKKINQGS